MNEFFFKDNQPSYEKSYEKPQKRESVRTVPAYKTSFPNALRCKAQKLWELAQQDRMSLRRARKEFQEWHDLYSEGLDNLHDWYRTEEGSAFKQWIEQ